MVDCELGQRPEEEFRRLWVISTRPRKRINFRALLAQRRGFAQPNPGFCTARAAIERHFKRLSRFGGKKKTGGFSMARARINYLPNYPSKKGIPALTEAMAQTPAGGREICPKATARAVVRGWAVKKELATGQSRGPFR